MFAASVSRVARASVRAFIGTVMAGAVFAASATPRIHTVTIEGMHFVPETVTVHRGDRVVWVNNDPFPHTVTGRAGGFDSHSIAPNASWRYVADKAGRFSYICAFHLTMKGTLVVE